MVSIKKETHLSKHAVAKAIPAPLNDTGENAQKYAIAGFENTYFLGYRELPLFLEKYSLGTKAIDYGCGTGRSTRFLQSSGFEVIGVDISKKMLNQAKQLDNTSCYVHIQNARIPAFNDSCDLVLSAFVLFTVSSKTQLLAIFKEAYRCLRKGGVFIIVTGSEDLYNYEWLSYQTNYLDNKRLKSGDKIRIKLRDLNIEFNNYYWTNKDYNELIFLSGFNILEKHFPYGKPNEGKPWISEMTHSPYVIYVLQK